MIIKKIKQLWYRYKYADLYKAIKEETILYPELMRYKEEFIYSMEVLIGHYKDAIAIGRSKESLESIRNISCLLCNPLGVSTNRGMEYDEIYEISSSQKHSEIFNNSCKNLGCPWMVITGLHCTDWSYQYMDSTVYNTDDSILQEARIKQLENWIKLYKEHEE